jgi:uracil-DNA glycosylase
MASDKDTYIPDPRTLRNEVYTCMCCERLGFTGPGPDKPFFKFPPTIGASGEAPILFVGINPRRSRTNRDLHDALMASADAFHELARNRYQGRRYIALSGGLEEHYVDHARVVGYVFPGHDFEGVAAVTELFLCAKEKSSGLPVMQSPCAEQFLDRTVQQVKPKVIVPVGKQVLRYFQHRFRQTEDVFSCAVIGQLEVRIVPMSHPAAYAKDAIWSMEWTVENVMRGLSASPALPLDPPEVTGGLARTEDEQIIGRSHEGLEPAATYQYSRLCFKADIIEPLSPLSQFRVVTPIGTFQMSKADFYQDFPNVVASTSYRLYRIYHYPTVPRVAWKYRV